ncbi:MAG: MFS transporter [Rhodospirillaceae bacterium]|nr:MAG: MFS transporter [Rhodospirillaceae bacterium]
MWSYRLAAVLAASVYLIGAGEFMLAPLLTPLAEAFGGSPAEASWLISAHAFAYAAAAPVIGLAFRHWPRRRLILAALLLFALDAAVLPLAPTIEIALLLRILGGVAAAALIAPVFALIADLVPPQSQTGAMGLVTLGITGGIVSGPVFAGLLTEAMDWRAAFGALAVAGLTVSACAAIYLPHGTPRITVSNASLAQLRHAPLLRPLATKAIWLGAAVAGYLLSGEILRRQFGLATADVGLATSLFGIGLGLGNLMAQPVQRLLRRIETALPAVLLLIALAMALFLVPANLIIALAALCLWGIGLGMAAPISTALLAQRAGPLPGPVLAISESANNLALMAMLPVAAALAASRPAAIAIWLLGLMAAALVLSLIDGHLSAVPPLAAYRGRGSPPASSCSPARPPDSHR